MKILCGTDFTPAAGVALEAAAALVRATRGTLRLVYAQEGEGSDLAELAGPGASAATAAARATAEDRLRDAVNQLDGAGAQLEFGVLGGHADEAIVAEAERWGADLIVVGALGTRSARRWRLGSTADRVAQHAGCPVLVARSAEGLNACSRGERPLRVVAAVDPGASLAAMLRWLLDLSAKVRCEIVGAHVYWPPEVRERLKLRGPIPIGKDHPEVDAALAKEIDTHLQGITSAKLALRIVGGLGRVADHLVQIAEDEKADLIAVGSHQRQGLDRLWHGSVSHGVIDAAPMNVLCVPVR